MQRTLPPQHPPTRSPSSPSSPSSPLYPPHHHHLQVSGEEVAPDADFAAKFSALPSITPESIIILLDSTGEEAASAAATLLATEELSLQKVFYVKVRAAGLHGWAGPACCLQGCMAVRQYGSSAVCYTLCAALRCCLLPHPCT
jgi:hypothetical protein